LTVFSTFCGGATAAYTKLNAAAQPQTIHYPAVSRSFPSPNGNSDHAFTIVMDKNIELFRLPVALEVQAHDTRHGDRRGQYHILHIVKFFGSGAQFRR